MGDIEAVQHHPEPIPLTFPLRQRKRRLCNVTHSCESGNDWPSGTHPTPMGLLHVLEHPQQPRGHPEVPPRIGFHPSNLSLGSDKTVCRAKLKSKCKYATQLPSSPRHPTSVLGPQVTPVDVLHGPCDVLSDRKAIQKRPEPGSLPTCVSFFSFALFVAAMSQRSQRRCCASISKDFEVVDYVWAWGDVSLAVHILKSIKICLELLCFHTSSSTISNRYCGYGLFISFLRSQLTYVNGGVKAKVGSSYH